MGRWLFTPYSFYISGSTDGTSFTSVYSGKSKGTSTATETYSFADSPARFVKVTITKSISGSSKSSAQISELDIFGKAGASGIGIKSSDSSLSSTADSGGSVTDRQSSGETITNNDELLIIIYNNNIIVNNNPPSAKDDRIRTEENKPAVSSILANDKDPDGDTIKITSVSSPKKGGTVTINEDQTITLNQQRILSEWTLFPTLSQIVKGKPMKQKYLSVLMAWQITQRSNRQQDQPRQANSSSPQNTNPVRDEQKQILDTAAQKIKSEVLSGHPNSEELQSRQGLVVANTSRINDSPN